MEIIKRFRLGEVEFLVIKSFLRQGEPTKIGDRIALKDPTASREFQRGRVEPLDVPPVGVYIAISGFVLPGAKEKFECKPGERVEIRKDDAIGLLREAKIVPEKDEQWRPWNRKLKALARS